MVNDISKTEIVMVKNVHMKGVVSHTHDLYLIEGEWYAKWGSALELLCMCKETRKELNKMVKD